MAGDEIGVKMREEDVPDLHPVRARVRQVLIHVPLRIDHCRGAALRVGHEVGRVRETAEVVLGQDHAASTTAAIPCPPPMHSVARPNRSPR